MYYIEETDKHSKINKIFKRIQIKDNKIILPIEYEEVTEQYQQKLATKTYKFLQSTNSNKIVISKKIKKYEPYTNYLKSYNVEIVDGKWLYKIFALNIFDYIVNTKELEKQNLEVAVTANYISDIEIETIKKLALECKTLNIVTNHIEKFKKIQEALYNEQGIIVTVCNNKKKSLKNSKIIINFDFPKELLNKYNIFDEAIIVNIDGNMKITKKRFNGLVVNDFEINNGTEEKYSSKEVYEAQFFKKQSIKYVREKIKKDNVKIERLLGNNGVVM